MFLLRYYGLSETGSCSFRKTTYYSSLCGRWEFSTIKSLGFNNSLFPLVLSIVMGSSPFGGVFLLSHGALFAIRELAFDYDAVSFYIFPLSLEDVVSMFLSEHFIILFLHSSFSVLFFSV